MNKKIVASVLFLLNSIAWSAEGAGPNLTIKFVNLFGEEPQVRVICSWDIEAAKEVAKKISDAAVFAPCRKFSPSQVIFEMLEMREGKKQSTQLSLKTLIDHEKKRTTELLDEKMEPLVKTFKDCFFKGDFTTTDNFRATGCCIEGNILYCVYDPFPQS